MKAKQKDKNAKEPNPFFHTLIWGFVGGTILQLLSTAFFYGLAIDGTDVALRILSSPYFWLLALQYGGLTGAALGLANGLVLWALKQRFQQPFTREAMQAERFKVYSITGSITLVLAFAFTTLLFWPPRFDYSLFGLIVPFPPAFILGSFIAGIASAYVAHRYLFRLRLWSEAEYGDEKLKNTERLEDKLKNDNSDSGEADESEKYEAS